METTEKQNEGGFIPPPKSDTYVCGFMFNEHFTKVALIKKEKPLWQAGRLNGIGGSIEKDEASYDAMIREFFEETGVKYTGWERLGNSDWGDAEVFYFYGSVSNETFEEIQSKENEVVEHHLVRTLIRSITSEDFSSTYIEDLSWIIPMAFVRLKEFAFPHSFITR